MRRTSRLLVAAALVGVLAPTAVSQTAVSAVDQDLVVSATSGAAGTDIAVSSASCVSGFDGDTFRYLNVRLLVGTAPNQVLAGSSFGNEDDNPVIVVPDWVDPTEPAVIDAQCLAFDLSDEDVIPPVQTIFTFDPVPFDVEAGPGAPVQARTYSRTSLQAGQAFSVDASGCFLDSASQGYVDVVSGSDLTFPPTADYLGFSGNGEIEDGSFSVITALMNGGVNVTVSGSSGSPNTIEVQEVPTDIPAGTYSSVAYCTRDDGATLFFEPELIEVTGNAPYAEMDLTVPAESRTATVAGGGCTAGDVDALVWGEDIEADDTDELLGARPAGPGPALRPAAARTGSPLTASSLLLGTRSGGRSLSDEPVEIIVPPAADGSWSATQDAGFDHGLVGAFAMCGDPLGDGFLYDDQAAVVSVTEVAPTTPPTTPTTTPPPAPANAVAGSPTYAG